MAYNLTQNEQLIISKMIKDERIKARYTQKKLASQCYLSTPYISRIETGDCEISYETAIEILNCLKSNFDISFEQNEYYNKLIDDFYIAIIYDDHNDIKTKWSKVIAERAMIEKSLCLHRYVLYELVYANFFRLETRKDVAVYLINNLDYYSIYDKQILFDNIGIYYKNQKAFEAAKYFYDEALVSSCSRPLVDAMVYQHIAANLARNNEYISSYKFCEMAIDIFEKNSIIKRIINCKIILGNICSEINEKETALNSFIYVYKNGDERDKKIAIHNILLCYARTNDISKADAILDKIDKSDPCAYESDFYELVLWYLFKNNKKAEFELWYRNYKLSLMEDEFNLAMIELYKSAIDNEDIEVIKSKAEYALSYVRLPYDEEEYETIKQILIQKYTDIGDSQMVSELLKNELTSII